MNKSYRSSNKSQMPTPKDWRANHTLNSSLDLSRINAKFRKTETFKEVINRPQKIKTFKKRILSEKEKAKRKLESVV